MTKDVYRSAAGRATVERAYRDVLERWPVPADHRTVPTRAGDAFVLVSGPVEAPPVLALQGSGANAALWRPRFVEWAPHLRVHAVDLPGEPGLSAPQRPPLAGLGDWLDDVRAGLGLDRVGLVGVSLGGLVALDHATRHPHRVTRLALLNPAGIGRRRTGFLLRAAVLSPFGEWGRRRTLAAALGPLPPGATPDADLADLAMLVFRHFRPRLESLPTYDRAALARLTMPVLAVLGARDPQLDAAETAARLRVEVPTATVLLRPDGGHLVDDAGAVLEFLRGPGA